jgi:hypothetical protein
MIASIHTGAGGGGYVVCARLLLLVGWDDQRLLARLKMSGATPLGKGRGFRLHGEGRKVFSVTLRRLSENHTFATAA